VPPGSTMMRACRRDFNKCEERLGAIDDGPMHLQPNKGQPESQHPTVGTRRYFRIGDILKI
jgi:hypothetical protein